MSVCSDWDHSFCLEHEMCNVCSQVLSSPLWPYSSSLFPIDTEHFNHACKHYSNPGIQMLFCCILSNELVRNDIIKVFNQSILGWKTDCIEISFRTSSFTLIKRDNWQCFQRNIRWRYFPGSIYKCDISMGPFRFVFNVTLVDGFSIYECWVGAVSVCF